MSYILPSLAGQSTCADELWSVIRFLVASEGDQTFRRRVQQCFESTLEVHRRGRPVLRLHETELTLIVVRMFASTEGRRETMRSTVRDASRFLRVKLPGLYHDHSV